MARSVPARHELGRWPGIRDTVPHHERKLLPIQLPGPQSGRYGLLARLWSFDTDMTPTSGTFWYHSHLALQYCDGLRGVIVIKDPGDPFLSMYDVDDGLYSLSVSQETILNLPVENTVIALSDWYHVVAETIVGPA